MPNSEKTGPTASIRTARVISPILVEAFSTTALGSARLRCSILHLKRFTWSRRVCLGYPDSEVSDTATTNTVSLITYAKALYKSPSNSASLLGVQAAKELRRFTSHQIALMAKPTEVCPVLVLRTPHVAIGSTT